MEYLVMLPGPTNVPERVMRAMITPMINHRSDDFVELYQDAVEKTQKVFKSSGEAVLLSASGTGAVEASVVNLIKKGDKVIIPTNGEFSGRLAQMLEWAGANVVRLESTPGTNATFDQVKEAFDNNKDVKAFYCVWNETSTGTMIKYLDKIKNLTARNDAFYVVDGVSIVGGEDLEMDKWGIDVAMTGAQKAFAAPPGISPIVVNERAKKYMNANPPNSMYFNLSRYFKYYEEAKHTPFTPALPLLYAYREAMNVILEEGLDNRIKRHRVCSQALYSGLSELGLTPFAKEDARSTVVVALNYLEGLEDKTFRNTLAEKFRVLVAGGFGNLKGKVFRVGCMGEVQEYHVMRSISAIGSTLEMMGYKTKQMEALKVAEEKLKQL
ncbi:MAG: alanine--glyoxylate aminotransferase family protein [Nitrososphaeria archaeon]|nr:alanine--glyoxylate aminotransferase family protein [Nitrososphaeria archaeon]NDB51128.1 alanine--glyoxylate aminotransferase family protein [Nitrosopumilaceae archaeon]NDB87838.1 alanine--glyoxylate aminotransferase family protein [Nitrososphaerota archaeon]NDB46259.1 alanine--glyoxylate aminotransferase family protein [Nitrososphaeria archaeon]NDB89757.1 alanine--glyoxylate aminotransferase family protein [Nitrososphaerota archaeon]